MRLGVLFIAFNVDRKILYSGATPSEEDYADAVHFYKTFYEAPLAIKVCLFLAPLPSLKMGSPDNLLFGLNA